MISKIVFAVAVDMAQIFCEQRNSGIQREQQRTKETCHLVERDLAHSRESFRGKTTNYRLLQNISPAAIDYEPSAFPASSVSGFAMDATEQENCESELYLAQANQTSRFNTQQDAREGRLTDLL